LPIRLSSGPRACREGSRPVLRRLCEGGFRGKNRLSLDKLVTLRHLSNGQADSSIPHRKIDGLTGKIAPILHNHGLADCSRVLPQSGNDSGARWESGDMGPSTPWNQSNRFVQWRLSYFMEFRCPCRLLALHGCSQNPLNAAICPNNTVPKLSDAGRGKYRVRGSSHAQRRYPGRKDIGRRAGSRRETKVGCSTYVGARRPPRLAAIVRRQRTASSRSFPPIGARALDSLSGG